ncbi:gliding motility-associated C-terminal domain-containing protein [Flexithrix dorotheae]|uniref:gliding motility-associated C-terminal domain-containing protein n=1 Tax=Flexithrix dorotheae TaxID=70993 RepID=UPI00036B5D62|nr:T9SS C-terminal target domain-containing protein [Flexithrix dorotheae]
MGSISYLIRLLLVFIFLLGNNKADSQNRFKNPSFEGERIGREAPFWTDCKESETTSNLQPGHDDVRQRSADGFTYLGLVTRGNVAFDAYERVSQQLNYPLSVDTCYHFSVMLSHSKKGEGYSRNSAKAKLRIWGGNNACTTEELLWLSSLPQSDYWTKHDISFIPTQEYDYIILEAYYDSEPAHRASHILIDDLKEVGTLPAKIPLELRNDTTICRDENILLKVVYPADYPRPQYLWSTGSTEESIEVTEEGKYSVEITNGCFTFKDSVYITHEKCLFIPNVFTPNNDGYNDQFSIQGIGKGEWELRVYNRWGEEVYSHDAYKSNWRGEEVKGGTYFYKLVNKEKGESYHGPLQIIK